jgi:alpha-mannosidase
VDNPALVIEAVKLAEDGSGDVVVRLYESLGQRSAGVIKAAFPVRDVQATDLLERPGDAPGVTTAEQGSVSLALRPFQLVTLRFSR